MLKLSNPGLCGEWRGQGPGLMQLIAPPGYLTLALLTLS